MSAPSSNAVTAVAVDVILRDGSTLRLRAPANDDAGALVAFFELLSADSRYLRFHGVRHVDATLVEHVLDPDWVDRGALIGSLTDEEGAEHVVALAEYARLRDPTTAEVAFTVADKLQGRGAATRLLEQLATRAAEVGIEQFVAEVLPENAPMLAVFRDAGFEVSRTLGGGEIEVRFPIATTEQFRTRVEERDHIAVAASLRPFFAPASVAVIGASKRRGSIGGELFRNILAADFAGAAYPVNRDGEAVAGVRAYGTIEEIPDPVDLAVICVPGRSVLESAQEALRKGVKALCVISAGFAEVGSEGAERQEQLLALVRAHGARLVGPNCLGIAVPAIGLNATFAPRALPPGRIAFSSQSGALGLALLEKAAERGLGFSSFVSIGNKADVSSNDLLEWWEEDDATDVVLLYLESFGNPQKFARVAGRLARRKPILALKAGTSRAGARAASSHTAALAGSDAAVEALFRSAGVLRAHNLEELVDVATLLSSQPLPRGRRVAVLTNAGGLGILCADACDAADLELPELAAETRTALAAILPAEASLANPVDLLGSATGATYAKALPHILRDPGIDALIVLFVPPVVAGADEVGAAIREALEREPSEKPVLAVVVSADGTPDTLRGATSPVATFAYPESAAHALGVAAGRAEWLRRPAGTVPPLDDVDQAAARRLVDAALATSSRRLARCRRRPYPAGGLRSAARSRSSRRRCRRGGRGCGSAGTPGGAQDRCRRRAQDRERRRRAQPRDRRRDSCSRCAHRRAVPRAADDPRRHRAAGRDRAGSALRPARRVRSGRRARGADRRRRVPDRTADRPRRRRARRGRQGRTAGTRLPRCRTRGRAPRSARSSIGSRCSRSICPRSQSSISTR